MYLTIKFVADGMMEPRILAVCNLSIKTDEPEIVKRAYHDTILETYTKDFAGNAADLLPTCWRPCRTKSCSSIRQLRWFPLTTMFCLLTTIMF